jgi:hypothetical protein
MAATVASGAVAVSPDDPAVGTHLDFQQGAVLGAVDWGEGPAAALAVAVVGGQFVFLDDGGQVAVVASCRAGLSALLSAWAWRALSGLVGVRGVVGRGSGVGFGFRAEELLFAKSEFGFAFVDALLEEAFALTGALMHGLPVGGQSEGLEFLDESWADGTGRSGQRRCGTRRRGVLGPSGWDVVGVVVSQRPWRQLHGPKL